MIPRRHLLAWALAAASGRLAAQTRVGADAMLIEAAAAGDAREARRLIASGASVHARDASGRTALLAATQGNHEAAAKLLIEAGADVNAQDSQLDSAYLLAGARGYLGILRMMLAAGANLKSTNRFVGTALIPACHYGHVEIVRELLRTGIDVNHVNRLGWTALLEAVILGDGGPRHTEIVRLLLAGGASTAIADRDGVTPLEHARRRGYDAMARLLRYATPMQKAFEMKRRAIAAGDQAYGAVVILGDAIVGEGPSRVVARRDPSAHAEREAIRDAQRRLGTSDLAGCELVSTARPCAACERAAYAARIRRMVHGEALEDAGPPSG
jgi:ankyrin repeat protein/tRNA(Arg) A34 adenosine deaminase TadA